MAPPHGRTNPPFTWRRVPSKRLRERLDATVTRLYRPVKGRRWPVRAGPAMPPVGHGLRLLAATMGLVPGLRETYVAPRWAASLRKDGYKVPKRMGTRSHIRTDVRRVRSASRATVPHTYITGTSLVTSLFSRSRNDLAPRCHRPLTYGPELLTLTCRRLYRRERLAKRLRTSRRWCRAL